MGSMGKNTILTSDISQNLNEGDNVTIYLTDADGNGLANKSVTLTFKDANGKNTDYNLVTDDKGYANTSINIIEGSYQVNGVYNGEFGYKSSSFSKNVTINDNNTSESDTEDVQTDNSTQDNESGEKTYSDWQKDYETGEYDDEGSPIYRSVMSTSGGQYDPGIYESYWSENGLISERRIG